MQIKDIHYFSFLISIFLAISCSDPANFLLALNQEFVGGGSPPGFYSEPGVYDVKCRAGFLWVDGISMKTIKCMGSNWTDVPSICQGKILE